MFTRSARFAFLFAVLALPVSSFAIDRGTFPKPQVDATPATGKLQTAVFAGGCFWGYAVGV